MTLTKARRTQLILSWIGIGLGWAASLGLGLVLLSEWIALLVPAATAGALGVGVLVTKRVTAHHKRASITVGDLRMARPRRR
ncbi:MAG: hypothetical protein FJ207_09190 [Gemmatimonadetes bacterium]|nr:hypothetical protein [Gemmatimonadota bacterium]